jgi:hypothetical protein
MQRSQLSGEDIVLSDDARLGWIRFSRAMDTIDAGMAQRGLTDFNQKGAEDLRVMKDLMVSSIAEQHPAWFHEYNQRDDTKWDNKIAGMSVVVADKRLSQRPDIEALKKYLQMRSDLMGILLTRDSTDIKSRSNADLMGIWNDFVQTLKTGPGGLAFSDLHSRYLVNDPLTSSGMNTIGV